MCERSETDMDARIYPVKYESGAFVSGKATFHRV
jgi:hypothetical protein